jgi:hypothetical protein
VEALFPVQLPAATAGERLPSIKSGNNRAKSALQASHWGYPSEFCERPFGSYLRSAMASQVENGLAVQMVLYRFDFVAPNGAPGVELNRAGRARLEKVAGLTSIMPCPLVIEVDETDPALNAARRAHVLNLLRTVEPSFPDERVVVARPAARGLAGDEALLIQQNLMLQTQLGASVGGAGPPGSAPVAGAGMSGASTTNTFRGY